MKRPLMTLGSIVVASALVTSGCHVFGDHDERTSTHGRQDDEDDDGEGEETEEMEEAVALADVPDEVIVAAVAAIPGLVVEQAEMEHSGSSVVYCLEGSANGVHYDIDLSPTGDVIEIDKGGEDEDDD